jgi:hypothetical protein
VKPEHESSTWYREPMVWLVVGIPGIAVLMGAVMLTLAVTTYDGLVADDYYKRGLQINRSMERDTMAERHGLASVEPPEIVNLRLFHATRPGLDLHVVLRRIESGRYLASRPDLAPGRWYVQLDADEWRLKGELEGREDAQRLRLGRAAAAAR